MHKHQIDLPAVGRSNFLDGHRLLHKAEVVALTGFSYPTIWKWMRQGCFPRSYTAGGRAVWRDAEVREWIENLPRTKLKGDDTADRSGGAER